MTNPAHKALLAVIEPGDPHPLRNFIIGVGPDFALGKRADRSEFRALLMEVKTSSIEATDAALWTLLTTQFRWALPAGGEMTDAGRWVHDYESMVHTRGEKLEPVLWGVDPSRWP